MKRLSLLYLFLFSTLIAFALDTNELFGFQKQLYADGYHQYIGKVFYFRQAQGKYETWDKTGFTPRKYNLNKLFTITNISVKKCTVKKQRNNKIIVEAIQNGAMNKVKFQCFENALFNDSITTLPLIGYLPIVFVEPLSQFMNDNVGKMVSHPLVKDKYEISDVFITSAGKEAPTAAIGITVKNERTGEKKNVLYSNRHTAPFDYELQGNYKVVLYQVAKPQNPSIKYGKTKIVEDSDVTKYTYVDNTIEIMLFNTTNDFSFVLKNISDHSIKIIWNDASYVDNFGQTSKIIHSHINYSEKEHSQPATTIISGAKITDYALPSYNIHRTQYVNDLWTVKPLFPLTYSGRELGDVRLMLPIQIKDVINEYVFIFKVYFDFSHPELLYDDNYTIPTPILHEV